MWLSIHAAFTEEAGGKRGGGRGVGGGEGGGTGGGGGGGTVVSEEERWSFSSSWLREKEKQLVCKWMPLPYSWMTRPSLCPVPPSSPPFLPSALSGCLERGTPWRGGLPAEHLCKIWINKIAEGVCLYWLWDFSLF